MAVRGEPTLELRCLSSSCSLQLLSRYIGSPTKCFSRQLRAHAPHLRGTSFMSSDQLTLVIYCCIEGDEILHSYMGDCFISHEIQDPEIKTTRMTHGMSKQGFCSTLLKLGSRPSPSFHWDSSPVGIQCIFSNNDLAMFHHLRNDVLWKSWFCRGFKWWYSFHPDFVWCLRGTYSQKALL